MICALGCGATEHASKMHSSEEYCVYTDDCGREVTIPNHIEKVVPSGPISQVVLYSLSPDMMVGLASRFHEGDEEYISEEVMNLPYLGELFDTANMNIEELVKVNPDIIIDIGEAKSTLKEELDRLQMITGIPCIHIEATLKTMPAAYRKLGEILNREEKAGELAKFCNRIYSRTETIMEEVGDRKIRAIYLTGIDGLYALGKGSFSADIVDMLTDNVAVFDTKWGKGTGNEVTLEQIAVWNPDFVILSPDNEFEDIGTNSVWNCLDAINDGRYVKVPQAPHNWMGTPPSVQRYLGLIWLTHILYPENCDYNVYDDVVEYYKLFYDYDMSFEQYEKITNY